VVRSLFAYFVYIFTSVMKGVNEMREKWEVKEAKCERNKRTKQNE